MKERPILFNGPMVRALLDGSKTQREFKGKNGGVWPRKNDLPGMRQILRNCPYGQPGERLWVRETWMYGQGSTPIYRADTPKAPEGQVWRPSIFMPRAASRILLEVVSVRVERLQDISNTDASNEGVRYSTEHMGHWSGTGDKWFMSAQDAYRNLWESINGAGSWDANPWVWAVEFKKVTA